MSIFSLDLILSDVIFITKRLSELITCVVFGCEWRRRLKVLWEIPPF